MPIGTPELLVISCVIVLLFGPSKLPKLGQSLGESLRNFKRGISEAESLPHSVIPTDPVRESIDKPSDLS